MQNKMIKGKLDPEILRGKYSRLYSWNLETINNPKVAEILGHFSSLKQCQKKERKASGC